MQVKSRILHTLTERYRPLRRQPKPFEVRDDIGGLTVAVQVARQRTRLTVKVHLKRDLADAPLASDTTTKAFAFTPVTDRAWRFLARSAACCNVSTSLGL